MLRFVLAGVIFLSVSVASAQGPAIQVATGLNHTCAVVAGGRVKCWGDNTYGQLGDGTYIARSTPVDVVGLQFPIAVVATGEFHSCALSTAGAVKCWGSNYGGQLGDGTLPNYGHGGNRNTPVDVVGLSSGVMAIAAGTQSCALTTNGAILCWGQGAFEGPPGLEGFAVYGEPRSMPGLSDGVVGIAAGVLNSAAITHDGRVKYWGREGYVMSCPTWSPVCFPVPFEFSLPKDASFLPSGITVVSVRVASDTRYGPYYDDYYNLCALAPGGRVMCWGGNSESQGHLANRPELDGLSAGVTAISMGGDHNCVLASGGIAQCWGENDHGQMGDGTTNLRRGPPITPSGLPPGLLAISAGGSHTCALTMIGELMCWGANARGQLGDGTTDDRHIPVKVIMPVAPSYQGLWWKAPAGSESGWGINFSHQGDIIFATWFTYDAQRKPWWLIAELHKTAAEVYSGPVSTVTGPPFNAEPFPPEGSPGGAIETTVGTMTATFSDTGHGTLVSTVNGVSQTKAIVPQRFGPMPTCAWGAQPNLALATNYTDLWWRSPAGSESGWGINLNHQGDVIFATWFTYDAQRQPWWLIAELHKTAAEVYSGPVSTVTGPPFNAEPFPPEGSPGGAIETIVGTATLAFADGNAATFAYTVNGVVQTKPVIRQVFVPPGTVCQ